MGAFKKLAIVLEMIKFEHTIFALPFAFIGAFLAARGFPGWMKSFWIIIAMVGARSAAMAFNRLADRRFDRLNPRTANRALAKGLLSVGFVWGFVLLSSSVFIFAAWRLTPLAFYLSPVALATVLLYSYTKRFTSFSHMFLGLALALAPVGAWIAVRGDLVPSILLLSLVVLLWVAGFDIIYACQDQEFDRRMGLYSFPSRLGIRKSLWISTLLHLVMVFLLFLVLRLFQLSYLSWAGFAVVVAALIYEHSLVRPEDLSRVNAAFFTVNGFVSIVLFLSVGLDLCLFA